MFIKKKGKKKECKVFHSDLWGLRNNKYDWLLENYITTTEWKEINPKSEFYLFIPRDEELLENYEKYPKVTEIFFVNSVGIVTSRDGFVIDPDKETIKRRIRMFRDKKMPDEIIKQTFKLKDKVKKNKDGPEKIIWDVKGSREKVINNTDWEKSITRILYRPFDIQWIFYHDVLIERSRKEVMQHMLQENLGLITNRQVNGEFRHILCTDMIINDCTVSLETKERSYLLPLYLYKEKDKPSKSSFGKTMILFEDQEEYGDRRPNLAPELVRRLTEEYKKSPDPEDIFYYIYGVLYSNTYRTKYAEFLKIDFPRVPFTKDYKLFIKMGKQGKRLVDLHLMKSKELDKPVAKFQGKGDNKVEKLRYEEDSNQLFINKKQYFDGITPEIWQYQVGGYQVCDKWLKDRKGKLLSAADIKHYCRVVTVLQMTIEIQKDIDKIYPEVEDKIIEVRLT